MKLKQTTLAGCCLLAVGVSQGTLADSHAPTGVPIEIYQCNYLEGKGPTDLDRVSERWSKWADKNEAAPYNAWTLTPNYVGPLYGTFDVGWLGAWPNGAAMGKTSDQTFFGNGREMISEFYEVVSCSVHAGFAAFNVYRPEGMEPPENGVIEFRDCTLEEGKTPQDASKALHAWAKLNDENGVSYPVWMFYPGPGNGDSEFDFKTVRSFPDYESHGKSFDYFVNGGGYQKAMEMFDGLMDCNHSRIYTTKLRRLGFGPGE